jgi:IS5 family transposase
VAENLEAEVEDARHLLDGVTSELKQGNLRATPELSRSLELLEKAVNDREEGAKDRLVSPVDPDARAGKKDHQLWAGYKGHVVIEEDSEIITAIETTPANKDDGNQLKGLLKQQEHSFDLIPDELSADKAYGIGANLDILESKGITGYISLIEKFNRIDKDLFTQDDFKYDRINGTLTCPAGCVAAHSKKDLALTEKARRNGIVFEFSRHQCKACELRPLCYNGSLKVHGRAVHISVYESYYQQMKVRMESEEGKAAYRNRYKIEHKVADLARYCGMRRCRYRGLTKAKIHTLLSATVSNIKRMTKLLWTLPESPPQMMGLAS